MAFSFPRTNNFRIMSDDPTDVQDFIDSVNENRGRGDGDDDDGNDDSNDLSSGGFFGGGSWESTVHDPLGGYAPGGPKD